MKGGSSAVHKAFGRLKTQDSAGFFFFFFLSPYVMFIHMNNNLWLTSSGHMVLAGRISRCSTPKAFLAVDGSNPGEGCMLRGRRRGGEGFFTMFSLPDQPNGPEYTTQ